MISGNSNLSGGTFIGNANIVGGNLTSTINLDSLSIGSNATANISGGTIAGLTESTGNLILSGGSLNSLVSNGTTSLTSGNVTGISNITGGIFTSSVTLGSLNITGGTANLAGGSVDATTIHGGNLISSANVASLDLQSGTANFIGGSVTGNVSSNATLITSINLSNMTISGGSVRIDGGTTNITSGSGASATVSSGTLVSNAILTSLQIQVSGTANIKGGIVSGTTISAGTLNLSGGSLHALQSSGTTNLTGGNITGLSNVTGGTLTSNASLGCLTITSGTANITGGNVSGNTVTNSALNLTGGTLNNLTSSGHTTLTGGTVTGLANITGGIFESNITLNGLTVTSGTANITGGNITGNTISASTLYVTGGILNSLTSTGNTTLMGGTVTGLTNITGGFFESNVTIDRLTVTNGTANITGGDITGNTISASTLNVNGGTLNSLTSSGNTTLTGGTVTGLTNITGGLFESNVTLYSLRVTSGTANITGGSVSGDIISVATLNISGGTLNALTSSGNTRLTGGLVTGLTNVTGGTLTSNITLGNLTVNSSGTANLTGGSAALTRIEGGNLIADSTSIDALTINSGSATVTGGLILAPITGTSAANISITNYPQTLEIGQLSAGNLSIYVTSGNIVQSGSSNLTVTSLANLISAGNIELANATNDFSSISACGTKVYIKDINQIVLDTISATNFTLTAQGAITQTAASNVSTGTSHLNSSGAITLTQANDFGTILANGTDISITDINDIILGNISANNLTVIANGSITQSGRLNVSGTSDFQAFGNISLANLTNDYNTVLASGNIVSLSDLNSITLGSLLVNNLTVNAGGSIDQSGSANVTGMSSFTAINNLTLSDIHNNLQGAVKSRAGVVHIENANSSSLSVDSPTNTTINLGFTATFSVAATGNTSPSVKWEYSSNNGTTWNDIVNPTPLPGALMFNGSREAVTLPSGFSNFTNGFSTGFWVYPTANANSPSSANNTYLINLGNGNASDNIQLYRSGGSNDLVFKVYNGNSATSLVASNVIDIDTWQYFSVVEQANGTSTIYKNGTPVANGTLNVPNDVNRRMNYFGKAAPASFALFQGQINSLSMWNRPLSPTEISNANITVYTGNETGLTGYWPLDTITANKVIDLSPNHANGTTSLRMVTSTFGDPNSATFTFTTTNVQNLYQYHAVTTNSIVTAITNPATLTVNPVIIPSVTTEPSNTTISSGAVARFEANAFGIPSPSVQWQVSTDHGITWTDITDATNEIYTFNVNTGDQDKQYHAVFTNVVGNAVSSNAVLTVTPIMVTSTADSGPGSLRDAIAIAITANGDDTIIFDNSLSGNIIALSSALTINDPSGNLTITGLGKSNLTISGNDNSGIFVINTLAMISDLTLSNGTGSYGTSPSFYGGSIYSNNSLTLTNVSINSSSANFGSAIYQNGGSLQLISSNVANSVTVAGSGDLFIEGGSLGSPLTVLSGNHISVSNFTQSLVLGQFDAISANLFLTNGAITQVGSTNIHITGHSNLVASGNIILTNLTNNFSTISATGTNIQISDLDDLTINNISGNGTILITSNDLTIAGNVNATSTGYVSIIPQSGTAVSLGNTASGEMSLSQAELDQITASQLSIGGIFGGNVTLNSHINWTRNLTLISAVNIAEVGSGSLIVGDLANFVASGNITLEDASNNFQTLTACGTNIRISDADALVLSRVSATNLLVNTAGAITQSNGANVTGNASFVSDSIITLDHSTNWLGDVSSNGILSISDGVLNSLTAIAGSVDISSGTILNATTTFVDLNLTGGILNGLVVNSGTSNLSGGRVNGLANIANGRLISSQNIGQLQVGSNSSANISAGQVGNTIVSGILNATGGTFASITSGNITRLTSATVTGLSNVTGGIFTANATLGNLTIQTGAQANLTDGSANITIVAGGTLFANSTSLTALVVNSGSATITGGVITNPLSGTSANHVTITKYAQSLMIGQFSANNLTVNITNGTITQAVGSNLVVATTVDLRASGNIILSNSTNDFQGRVLAHGTNITLNDRNTITLDQIILTGDLHVTASNIAVTYDIVLQLHFPLDSVSSCTIVIESGHSLVSATPYRPDPCGFNC